jgi:5-methylcytosine-specific restriction protein A
MTIPTSTRAALLRALAEFDHTLRDAPEWQGWQDNLNYEWALVHRRRQYPVKQIIRMATGHTQFSGGPEANGYVEGLGFRVIPLRNVPVPTRQVQYWAFFADPDTYRIEDAIAAKDEDTWTVKLSEVRAGDLVVIWKGKGRSSFNGVVALGEVLSDPDMIDDSDNPFWVPGAGPTQPELRVNVRYYRPSKAPMWLQGSHASVLDELTVSRAHGGTVFRVTEDQWGRLVDALDGWSKPVPGGRAGGRNPKWAVDELILALDLYLRAGLLDAKHAEVVELSRVLNALPIHTVRPYAETFRNPNGVALKLANLAALDPGYAGKGMAAGGRLDAEVWHQYVNDREMLARLAAELREAADGKLEFPLIPEEGEDEYLEGRRKYRQHRALERSGKLVAKKKKDAKERLGRLKCEVCGFDFAATFGKLGDEFIECHHLVPLSESGETKSTIKDLALTCSNCHRMLHRPKPWLSIDDLRAIRLHHEGMI